MLTLISWKKQTKGNIVLGNLMPILYNQDHQALLLQEHKTGPCLSPGTNCHHSNVYLVSIQQNIRSKA